MMALKIIRKHIICKLKIKNDKSNNRCIKYKTGFMVHSSLYHISVTFCE